MIVEATLVLLAALGHLAICFAIYNRIHVRGLPLPWEGLVTPVLGTIILVVPAAYFVQYLMDGRLVSERLAAGQFTPATIYLAVCLAAGLVALGSVLLRPAPFRPSRRLVSNHTAAHNLATESRAGGSGSSLWAALARLPGNQILDLSVHEKTIEIPGLPDELEGLCIAHLSDLHITGRIGRGFFDRVIAETMRMEPDLIAVTGDILDNADCLDWLPQTLGRLSAPGGVYFLLGNHDFRNQPDQTRRTLSACGLIDVGNRLHTAEVRGHKVLIAGNEAPWGQGRPPREIPANSDHPFALRLALAHGPDQLPWARRLGAELMLAGHTHGGQIRLPLWGALTSPGVRGSRYDAGVFFDEPPIMHVSRGLSCSIPLRLNCPPELSKLVLRRGWGNDER